WRFELGKDRRVELGREFEVITQEMVPKKPTITPKNGKDKGKQKEITASTNME
ncbi:hypothetical protein KI387_021260, partial [Taxus chinensis]